MHATTTVLFIPSISHIITQAAACQPSIEPTCRAHHTVHRHTATRKYPDSDPQIDSSSASDWHSWIQPSAGSFSLHSVPPSLHLVHYIIQQSGPPSRSSCFPATRVHIRTTNAFGSVPDSTFRSSPGNII